MNEKHLKHSGPRRISGRSDRNDTFIFANNGPVSCRFIPADGSGSGRRSGKSRRRLAETDRYRSRFRRGAEKSSGVMNDGWLSIAGTCGSLPGGFLRR